jgi:tetratricopeptide (TPR) repeat protein
MKSGETFRQRLKKFRNSRVRTLRVFAWILFFIPCLVVIHSFPVGKFEYGIRATLRWLGQILLRVAEWDSYCLSALAVLVALDTWRVNAKIYGWPGLSRIRQALRLYLRSDAGKRQHVFYFAGVVVMLGSSGAWIATRIGLFLGLAIFAGSSTFSSLALASIPPSVLILTTSRRTGTSLHLKVEHALPRVRIVSLLSPKNRGLKKLTGAYGIFRTRDAEDWLALARDLMAMVAVVVLDTRSTSEAVSLEASSLLSSQWIGKVILIVGERLESPILRSILSREDLKFPLVPREIRRRMLTEENFINMLRERGFSFLREFQEQTSVVAVKSDSALGEAENLFGRGIVLSALGDCEGAINFYDKALVIEPLYADVIFYKALALFAVGRLEDGQRSLAIAIDLQPDNPDYQYAKGNELRKSGRPGEALEACERAIRFKPRHAEAWSVKGAALADLGRHDEALEALDKSVSLGSESWTSYYLRGNLLANLGRDEEALQSLEQAISFFPNSALSGYREVLFSKSVVLSRLERFNELIKVAEQLIQLEPGESRVLPFKGIALWQLGRREEALGVIDASLQATPDDPMSLKIKEMMKGQ